MKTNTSLVVSTLSTLVRMSALLNNYALLFRPWIVREPEQTPFEGNPNPRLVGTVYALSEPLFLAIFLYSGLALKPWILVLSISMWHLVSTQAALLLLTLARKEKHERRIAQQQNEKREPSRDWDFVNHLPWKFRNTRLHFYLLALNASAADASLLLLADRLNFTSAGGLETGTQHLWLTVAAISLYFCSLAADMSILPRASGLYEVPSSLRALSATAINLIGLLVLRAGIAWTLRPLALPLLEIFSGIGRNHAMLKSPVGRLGDLANDELSHWHVGSICVQILSALLISFMSARMRREVSIQSSDGMFAPEE